MYKVLLVDDERIILEGLSTVIDWQACGTELVGKAINGSDGFALVERLRPDIVITDLKMPVMTGLELIERTKARFPTTAFIILSGHDEFEFAQRAMQNGVKHYLLKPCDEHNVTKVLVRVVEELQLEAERGRFATEMRDQLNKVKPQLKQQLLTEMLTNKSYGSREWEYYRLLLDLPPGDQQVRLILIEAEGVYDFEHLFALHNISSELIGNVTAIHLSATIGERLALLIDDVPTDRILPALHDIQEVYRQYYELDFTAVVSDPGAIADIRKLYPVALEGLSYRFYMGEGTIMTMVDIPNEPATPDIRIELNEFALAVRSGNLPHVESMLDDCFASLASVKASMEFVKTHLIELYMVLIRQAKPGAPNDYLTQAVQLVAHDTLDSMKGPIVRTALEITQSYYDSNTLARSRIVQEMLRYIHVNLGDENLSLHQIATEVVYRNVDYLGKVFRAETGEKFTNYVLKARMELALHWIRSNEQLKVIDLSAAVGFGNNPQYFSQVFKKYTGYSPSEYRKHLSDF